MTDSLFKGHFITIEGGEGAGKSTLMARLGDYIHSKGYQVVMTREPGGSKLGELLRGIILNHDPEVRIGSLSELLLFLAARAQHIEELIRPSLLAGKVVLCDRFNDSTIAYQAVARGLDLKLVRKLCKMICGPVEPELTLFLDVQSKVGLQRTIKLDKENASAGKLDRIEAEELIFHEKVRQAFLALAKREPLRIYRIDANKEQKKVFEEAIRAVEELVLLPMSRGHRNDSIFSQ